MQGYSLKDLEQFLDYCSSKGLLKRNTATSRKTAATKILSQLDSDEQADIRTIDLAAAFNRWQNKDGAGYDPSSLNVYNSRLQSAVKEFLKYKGDPKSYKPGGTTRKSNPVSAQKKRRDSAPDRDHQMGTADERIPQSDSEGPTAPPLLFSVPIRPGISAWVRISGLPRDISLDEAKAASGLVKAMVEPLLSATAHSPSTYTAEHKGVKTQ